MLYDRPPLGGPAPQQRQVSQQQRMPQQGQMQHQGQQKGQQQGEDKKEHDVSQQVLCPPERFIGVPTSDLQEAFRGSNVPPIQQVSRMFRSYPQLNCFALMCSTIFFGGLRSLQ